MRLRNKALGKTLLIVVIIIIPSLSLAIDYPTDGTATEFYYDELGNIVRKQILLPRYSLNINKTFQADANSSAGGTVTSNPLGISCGDDCSEIYVHGTDVTLAASSNSCSIFSGWSGGGCSGTGTCTTNIKGNTTVTAAFNCKSPVAEFTSTYQTQTAPALVRFSDTTANCPATWAWNFGDATVPLERNQKNPNHIYEKVGTYTVSLTTTNCGGTNTKTKSNSISVTRCRNSLVRIIGGKSGYSTIQAAITAAVAGQTIQSHAVTFIGNVSVTKTLSLNGGYDCSYATVLGKSIIQGNLVIGAGTFTVTADNLEVK